MKKSYLTTSEQILLSILVFVLLQEWLKPVMVLTDTNYYGLFSLFIVICLVLSIFNVPVAVNWIIKLGFIIWFIDHVYNIAKLAAHQFFKLEIQSNYLAIKSMDWSALTDSFRSVLFLLLIWMLVYLIHHWITVRMSIFYFLVLTIFFIATLDSFSDYDGKYAIVKVLLVGLILTALLFIKRYVISHHISLSSQTIFKYMIPIILLVGLTGIAAYMLPKSNALWPDPVPFFENFGNGVGTGKGSGEGDSSIKKVGYGENDERLGGSFVADDTLVFQIASKSRQYWRVEAKDTYTSKGWTTSEVVDFNINVNTFNEIVTSTAVGLPEDSELATISNLSTHPFILQPYGIMSINPDVNLDSLMIKMNETTGKMNFSVGNFTESISNYDITFSEPKYSYALLKESKPVNSFAESYLALPDTLPQRVRDLAAEITETSKSEWDKARAIEKYFSRAGFTYATKDIPYPAEDEDYVDQFLFDSKVGYCDNFSSSMVVMLRSIGIPARWVKGFVTGDLVGPYDEERSLYNITNNEAHSWVEAYIDGVGWVPFEPTIGYNTPVDLSFDTDDELSEEELLEQQDDEKEQPEKAPQDEKNVEKPKPEEDKNWSFAVLKWPLIIVGALFVIGAAIIFFTRKKWLPKYYIRQNRTSVPSYENFILSYERLLKQLSVYGLKRDKNQTLSVYAKRVDHHFNTDAMAKLTGVYEELIYSKKEQEINYNKLKEIWEYLINLSIS